MKIDSSLVRKLIANQFPDLRNLPVVPIKKQGHDNRTFTLHSSRILGLARGIGARFYGGGIGGVFSSFVQRHPIQGRIICGECPVRAQFDKCCGMHECLVMDHPPFYRSGLDGQRIPVSFAELHPVLRDIVHYFEVNLNEPQNVLIMAEYSKQEYWKYLSISWAYPEGAESKRYKWLCQRGCLALLNGLSLDFLTDQQFGGSEIWRQMKAQAQESLPYLRRFEPADESLEEGRDLLLASFTFIAEMSVRDLDEDGFPNFATQAQGAWFTKNIVGDYFRSTAKLDFG